MRASFPINEEQRVTKLLSYGILDTQSEAAYDDLTLLASYICKTPIALVSLVDSKRQWFKSTVGLDLGETHRDLAFCAHAILQPDILVIPDAKEDERFVNHPLVMGEPYIRFYAGVPLITSDGFALGSLCVIDTQPRTLDSEQIKALSALGRQVISQLELRLSHQKLTQEILEHEHVEAERQQVEANLQKEQERLKAILDNLSDGVVACDEAGRLMLFNRATQEFHGLPETPLLPEEWAAHFDLYLADGKTPMPTQDIPLFRAFRGEVVHEAEMVIAPKQGKIRTLQASGRAFFDAAGNKLGAVVTMHDISDRKQAEIDRKQAEVTLQRSEERYRSLTIATAQIVWTTASDGSVAEMQNWQAYTGQTSEELEDGGWLQAIHPDELERTRQAWHHAIQTKSLFAIEYRIRSADGIYRYFLGRGLPILDKNGNIQEWIGTCTDIDDRKQAEIALQKALQDTEYQSRLLRTVLDSTQDWIYAKDQNFRYILVNRSFANALEQSVEAILGRDDLELGFSNELVFGTVDKNIRGFRPDDQIALSGETIHNSYDLFTTTSGSIQIFDTCKAPLYDANGKVFALIGFSRDMTEQYYAQEALRCSEAQLKEKAEELEQTLQELRQTQTQMIQAEKMSGLGQLVAGIAHEINNPVNFIHGNITPARQYTQDLLNLLSLYQTQFPSPSLDIQARVEEIDLEFIREDLPKLLASMRMGTQRIREIVLSLRNFSRLDESEMKQVDLHEGIDNTLVILGNRLKSKSEIPAITIVKQYDQLPLVECYAGQLNQVFMNILDNAIDALEEQDAKRTKQQIKDQPGSITIRTAVVNSNWVSIAIADTGPGMSEAIQKQIFNPFSQPNPSAKEQEWAWRLAIKLSAKNMAASWNASLVLEKGRNL
ncbi:PAS domain S-box protein [Nostoc sp. HG1]|nr:PAS domain S-box protein [Nostoc sp. HG1]